MPAAQRPQLSWRMRRRHAKFDENKTGALAAPRPAATGHRTEMAVSGCLPAAWQRPLMVAGAPVHSRFHSAGAPSSDPDIRRPSRGSRSAPISYDSGVRVPSLEIAVILPQDFRLFFFAMFCFSGSSVFAQASRSDLTMAGVPLLRPPSTVRTGSCAGSSPHMRVRRELFILSMRFRSAAWSVKNL